MSATPRRGRPRSIIPPELLGTAPDRVIAERLGLNLATVQKRRVAAGVPPHRKHLSVPTARLGVVPDTVLAAELGTTAPTVANRRRAAGIAVASRRDLAMRRDVRDGVGLGWNDARIGRALGICRERVRQLRTEMGLGRVAPTPTPCPDPTLLGSVPDYKLARRWGVGALTVRTWREAAGVPLWQRPTPAFDALDALARFVGVWTDARFAEEAGVHVQSVLRWRKRHGFASTRPDLFTPDVLASIGAKCRARHAERNP